MVFAPYAGKVPLAALAAILFVVAWNMSEAGRFLRMVRQAPRADMAILLITFSLTILTDLVVAVNIGVILAMFQFVRRMSSSVEVVAQDPQSLQSELDALGISPLAEDVMVYSINGPLFFGSVESLDRALSWSQRGPRFLVLRLDRVPVLDATGMKRLETTVRAQADRGTQILLIGASQRVLRKLVVAGIVSRDNPSSYFADLAEALAYIQRQRAASGVPAASPHSTSDA